MKKLLLSLAGMLMLCLNAYADKACFYGSTSPTGTYDFSKKWETAAAADPIEISIEGVVNLKLSDGGNSGAGKFDTNLRWYKDAKLTFTPAEGVILNEIKFQCASKFGTITTGSKSITTSSSSASATFSALNASEALIFSNSAQIQFQYIEIDYTAAAAAVKAPSISYELDGAEANVTISCETANATIYYGFSEGDVTNEYTSPFKVTEDCTVYAYAKVGEDKSLTKSLPITLPYTTFKQVLEHAVNKDVISVVGNFSVLYQSEDNKYLILTDGTSNMLVYNLTESYEVGTKISHIEGSIGLSSKLFEITDVTEFTVGGSGAEYTPTELTSLDGINYDDNLFDQVILKNVTISGKSGNNATIEMGDETIAFYNRFALNFENGEGYDITGFVWRYQDNVQIVATEITGGTFVETVKTPVISPSKNELKADEEITITCATEGAVIRYTTDGSDPTEDSEVYTGAITFDSAVTIKAQAFHDDMLPSEIATKEYALFNPYCNVIDNSHETSNKGSYVKHTCTVDGVDYAMVGVHNDNDIKDTPNSKGIQMNNSSTRTCYIIQTGDNEGLALESIEIDFNSNTKNIKFEVRASNTPFNDEGDVSANPGNVKTNGVKIGEITNDNPKVTFEKDYNYFALFPTANGVVYITSVTINYRDPKELDESEIPVIEDLEIISMEEGLMTDEIPTHEDWITKYKFNNGEETEYDPTEGGIVIDSSELEPASLHTLEIWYEHYYHDAKSESTVLNHVTEPKVEDASADGKVKLQFGKIGEGVKVYFTINGQNPVVASQSSAAVKRRAKAGDGTYTLDSADDKDQTHEISASNTMVEIEPSLLGETYTVKAQAVHTATGTASSVMSKAGTTTSISEIGVADGAQVVYDLMGRKVQRPTHGIYIKGGVKVRL